MFGEWGLRETESKLKGSINFKTESTTN